MATVEIKSPDSILSTYVAKPEGAGPFPGVCIVHDALGMTQDLRNQADWLASAGYFVAAPDLFHGKTMFGCMFRVLRDYMRKEGPLFDRIEAVHQWLAQHEDCSGKVGIIGFCFGGGFVLAIAPRGGYSVASANYGALPRNAEEYLKTACPVVASYGGLDRSLKGSAERLENILTAVGIDNDIKEYPEADHAFMNDHSETQIPFIVKAMAVVFGGGGGYHPESAEDARKRIVTFFDKHLKMIEA